MKSRSGVFTFVVIFFGLGLTVWWMYSAEEVVVVHRKVVDETSKVVKREVVLEKKSLVQDKPVVQNRKLVVLQEILDSKNDNDPRLDSEFTNLSDTDKNALQEKYLSYTPEKLNEKGTLVYLLGQNIENKKDLEFMGQVLNEKPCLSLADCSVSAPPPTGEAAHLASVDQITLAYPQIVAIKSTESFLRKSNGPPDLRPQALKNLEDATHSKSAVAAKMAALTLKRLSP